MKKTTGRKTVKHTGNRQAGGTLLGLVLGALLGLGAALAVAVYVTKVPIPFLNKSQPRSAENDAAEIRKNKDWDPNAGLAGKNAVKPPVAAGNLGTLETPAAVIAPQAAASAAKAPVSPVNPAAKAASSDPLGDLAKARSAAKPDPKPDVKTDTAAAGPTADPFSYFIQVGAFRTPEDAEQQRAKVLLMGLQAVVTEREQAGRTVYRVRLGPYNSKDEADRNKEKLDANSIETALVRVQR